MKVEFYAVLWPVVNAQLPQASYSSVLKVTCAPLCVAMYGVVLRDLDIRVAIPRVPAAL